MFCFNTLIIQHVVNHRKTTKVRLKCKGSMCQIKSVEYTNVRSLFVFVFLPSSTSTAADKTNFYLPHWITTWNRFLHKQTARYSYTIQGINRVFDLSNL